MRFALIAVITSGMIWACSAGAYAGVLPEFEPLSAEPGELIEQVIDWDSDGSFRFAISLAAAPEGAYLSASDSGMLLLRWQTNPDLANETQLTIQVRNVDTQSIVETRTLIVRKVERFRAPVSVSLDALAAQIVSVGRPLAVRISGDTSDGLEPLITIDRLPGNASFDRSRGGDYSFFWQTSDQDQGEHVFRITAQHPSDTSVTANRLLTIVVGNPNHNKTFPAAGAVDEN